MSAARWGAWEVDVKASQEIERRAASGWGVALAVLLAGVEVADARLSHLAYAPEIAGAMLRRQQAEAVVAARQRIVEVAVGMVQLALQQLAEHDVVQLDEERKAAMVSDLLGVLCGETNGQPIVNTGSLYT